MHMLKGRERELAYLNKAVLTGCLFCMDRRMLGKLHFWLLLRKTKRSFTIRLKKAVRDNSFI